MNKKQVKRLYYMPPQCEIIKTENESFICVSVRPNGGNPSSTDPWDEKNHEGGTAFFGDESSVAPAKKGVWEDDEEEDY